ncbi:MAG: anthranilate synthase component I family protein [Sediminibacterium sp.]|jgi:anthranilate synthase component 1
MQKMKIHTEVTQLLADTYTPVGIYLRLRDRFRDTVLLESTDSHASENSYSFIAVNAIGGIEISSMNEIEYKYPNQEPIRETIQDVQAAPDRLWAYMQEYSFTSSTKEARFSQGLYGYTAYDAIPFFDTIEFKEGSPIIPLMRYRLYQYVLAFNHFKDELYICENRMEGMESELDALVGYIKSKDVPQYPFSLKGEESSNQTDDQYREAVKKGIQHCMRGDVFQIVLSRRFQQSFQGDEFNVYRSLRNINPSPYLFFFDYGDYKLMGSSPEAQIIINNGKAVVHPIAGTFKRSGDEAMDAAMTQKLLDDPKENAEHVMLVDLARNDLSRVCTEVRVKEYRQVHYYSHVIHLVSEVEGKVAEGANPFHLIAKTFPAGTLSGAPKFKAMQLIDAIEPTKRSYYGGCIGFVGFDGTCNQAIMIRTFLSRENTLTYQAGAGVVAASVPESELQEVNNKLNALKNAMILAENIH